jgi:hypothetical protein
MRLFRRHRKLIKFAVFLSLPILAFGLIKLTLWYSTKLAIDNLTNQSEGIVEIKYKTITSSLKGSVSVNAITIFIPVAKESIHIKSIRLSADNLISLLKLSLRLKFESDEIPKSLSLIIEGLKVDINSKLINLPKDIKQTPFERFSTLACGDTLRFDEKVLTNMGYSEIETDFNIYYSYDKLSKSLSINLYENMDRFFNLDFSAELKGVSKIPDSTDLVIGASTGSMPQGFPQLGKVKLTINDDSFISRKVTFCANNNNSNKKDYIKKHVGMASDYLQQLGLTFNQSLIDAYTTSLTHPGNVIVSMDFSSITDPMELSQFLLDDVLVQLNTELLVNNKSITPISIKIDQKQFSDTKEGKIKAIKINDPNVKVRVKKKYHVVNKNNLQKYNKHMVIVKTTRGKTYKGQLHIKGSNKYEIIARTRGGEIGYFVKNSEIKSIDVFY